MKDEQPIAEGKILFWHCTAFAPTIYYALIYMMRAAKKSAY